MRIGIDARSMMPRESGPGIYTRALVTRLAALAPEWDFVLYWACEEKGTQVPPGRNIRVEILGRPCGRRIGNLFFEQVLLPIALRRDRCDLLWSPAFILPVWKTVPQVVTMHDVIPLHFAEQESIARRIVYNRLLRVNAKAADRIITVSRYSRDDIVRWLGADPAKIRVVWNGIDECFRPLCPADQTDLQSLLNELEIPSPYILFTAGLLPRKNVHTLIQAVAQTPDPLALVLTGRADAAGDLSYFELLRKRIRALGMESRVVFTGYRSRSDVRLLYGGALLSVEPSLCEGFGFPVVESMACGCPVIVAERASLPEVAGGAALLVDPESVEEIAGAIARLGAHAELRAELRDRGLQRARLFSWGRSAEAMLSSFREFESPNRRMKGAA